MSNSTPPSWLAGNLEPGEELRWSGLSSRRIYRASPPLAVAFSLFALMFISLVLAAGCLAFLGGPSAGAAPPRDSSALSLPAALAVLLAFALVGVFLLLAPWVGHRLSRRLVGCAVTSRRALVVMFREGHKSVVQSYPADQINLIVARVYPDGFGNVWISSRVTMGKGHGISIPVGITWKGLLDIPDVRGASQALALLVSIVPEIRPALFSWLFRSPSAPAPRMRSPGRAGSSQPGQRAQDLDPCSARPTASLPALRAEPGDAPGRTGRF